MSHDISKVLDRVRKMLSLAEHSDNESEAALAASRAAKLMEEYQLSEALVRLDDPEAKPEAILKDARLEPDAPLTGRKRVGWKEAISAAIAKDLGVHEFFRYHRTGGRSTADVRGFGRETAIQTWQYTSQYLWRQVDELADRAWSDESTPFPNIFDGSDGRGAARAWKNAFRTGCAQRLAERIYQNRKAERETAKATREAILRVKTVDADGQVTRDEFSPDNEADVIEHVKQSRKTLALSVIEKDQAEVDLEYEKVTRTFTRGAASRIGQISSRDGYTSGRVAGDGVALGTKRAGLPAGQGRLKP